MFIPIQAKITLLFKQRVSLIPVSAGLSVNIIYIMLSCHDAIPCDDNAHTEPIITWGESRGEILRNALTDSHIVHFKGRSLGVPSCGQTFIYSNTHTTHDMRPIDPVAA